MQLLSVQVEDEEPQTPCLDRHLVTRFARDVIWDRKMQGGGVLEVRWGRMRSTKDFKFVYVMGS